MWRWYEFHLPHPINVATLQKPKMHVNTDSTFNLNYEIAVKCTKLH